MYHRTYVHLHLWLESLVPDQLPGICSICGQHLCGLPFESLLPLKKNTLGWLVAGIVSVVMREFVACVMLCIYCLTGVTGVQYFLLQLWILWEETAQIFLDLLIIGMALYSGYHHIFLWKWLVLSTILGLCPMSLEHFVHFVGSVIKKENVIQWRFSSYLLKYFILKI